MRLDVNGCGSGREEEARAGFTSSGSGLTDARVTFSGSGDGRDRARPLDDDFQVGETRVGFRSAEDGRLEARSTSVSFDCTIDYVGQVFVPQRVVGWQHGSDE